MKPKRVKAVETALTVALFVSVGMTLAAAPQPATLPPLSKSVTAPARALGDAFAAVAERVKPCVVTVYSEKTLRVPRFQWPFGGGDSPFQWFFGGQDDGRPHRGHPRDYQEFKEGGMGSGIIIDKQGHILTNYHVVQDMDQLKVRLTGDIPRDAKLVGVDPNTDLAVIELVDKPTHDLPSVDLGDSEKLRVGDWVLAIGAPFGYEQTVTAGIISAKGRTRVEDDGDGTKYEDFLQTDAAINPGNSGGPLVNMDGEVVGINAAIATHPSVAQFSGVGFAIPINLAKHVVHDLINSGKVTRGYLGIVIKDVDPDFALQAGLSEPKGARVMHVTKGSPADKAGLKTDDVITRFADAAVDRARELRNLVADVVPGTKVDVAIMRDREERTLPVTVGELTPDAIAAVSQTGEEPDSKVKVYGLVVEPLTADKAAQLGYKKDQGVLVGQIDDDSPAADANVKPGDLITEVNHIKVTNLDEFAAAASKSDGDLVLLIKRNGTSRLFILHQK